MTRLTIELQDDTYRQLRELAQACGISLDLLIENLGSAAHGAESRFRAFASEGNPVWARQILDRLDRAERKAS